MNLGVTGHRPDRLHSQSHLIYKWCEAQIINYKPTLCLSGMGGAAVISFIRSCCLIK